MKVSKTLKWLWTHDTIILHFHGLSQVLCSVWQESFCCFSDCRCSHLHFLAPPYFFLFFGQCCENCPCPHVVFFSIYGYITNSLPVDLMAQLVGELHRYRRGHGFKSRSGNLVSRTSPLEIGRGGKQFQREKPWEQGCVLAWVFIQAIISQQLKLCV